MKMLTTALAFCITFCVSVEAVQAGPCTKQINQFEAVMRRSSSDPDAGPTARETIGAKLGHQPTPASVEAAETSAQSRFASLVAKAKALDARDKHAACMRALNDAKRSFDLQ
jgi:hypothetical protein